MCSKYLVSRPLAKVELTSSLSSPAQPPDPSFSPLQGEMSKDLRHLFHGEEILLPLRFGEGWGGVLCIFARGLVCRVGTGC